MLARSTLDWTQSKIFLVYHDLFTYFRKSEKLCSLPERGGSVP